MTAPYTIMNINEIRRERATGKGKKWVTDTFSKQRSNVIISNAEKFLDNFELTMTRIGAKVASSDDETTVHINMDLNYKRKEWLASVYYIRLEYNLKLAPFFHRF